VDNKLATNISFKLRSLNDEPRPFFVMVGFRRPHLPWVLHHRFWDLYNRSEASSLFDLPSRHGSRGSKQPLLEFGTGLRRFTTPPNGGCLGLPPPSFPWGPDMAHTFLAKAAQRCWRKAYYAAISQVDHHIGMVISTAKILDLYNSTIIIFQSDHGHGLGEHGQYSKMSLLEWATRVPLMIRVPWKFNSLGSTTRAPFNTLDIYHALPKLAKLAEYEATRIEQLSKALDNPRTATKAAAFSQWPSCGNLRYPQNTQVASMFDSGCGFSAMGYTARVKKWRYVAWVPFNFSNVGKESASFTTLLSEELYFHAEDDMGDLGAEYHNVASDSRLRKVRRKLLTLLSEHVSSTLTSARVIRDTCLVRADCDGKIAYRHWRHKQPWCPVQ